MISHHNALLSKHLPLYWLDPVDGIILLNFRKPSRSEMSIQHRLPRPNSTLIDDHYSESTALGDQCCFKSERLTVSRFVG